MCVRERDIMGQENITQKRSSGGGGGPGGGLPTTTANGGRGRSSTLLPRGRQLHKTFNNIKITILCGFVTILVLRGTIGIGNLGSSGDDAMNQNIIEEINCILVEIQFDFDPSNLVNEQDLCLCL